MSPIEPTPHGAFRDSTSPSGSSSAGGPTWSAPGRHHPERVSQGHKGAGRRRAQDQVQNRTQFQNQAHNQDRAQPQNWARQSRSQAQARRRPWRTAVALTALLGLLTMTVIRVGEFDIGTPFVQLLAFMPWVALASPLVMVGCWFAGHRIWAGLAAVCVAANLVVIAPFFAGFAGLTSHPRSLAAAAAGKSVLPTHALRVMSINAKYGAADADQIVRLARDENADVLVVVELTTVLQAKLAAAGLPDYMPHQLALKVGDGPAGSGIWSRTPLRSPDTSDISEYAMPSAVVDASGMAVRVTAVHPLAPIPGKVDRWRSQLQALGSRAAQFAEPQVLAGDFNGGWDHVPFRDLLGDRFADATEQVGRGWDLSWTPVVGTPSITQLDHIVADREAGFSELTVLGVRGTDHRALVATVTFRE